MRLSYTYDLYDEVINVTFAQIDVELEADFVMEEGEPILDITAIMIPLRNRRGHVIGEVNLWEGGPESKRLAASIKTAAEDDGDLILVAMERETGAISRPLPRPVYSTHGVRT